MVAQSICSMVLCKIESHGQTDVANKSKSDAVRYSIYSQSLGLKVKHSWRDESQVPFQTQIDQQLNRFGTLLFSFQRNKNLKLLSKSGYNSNFFLYPRLKLNSFVTEIAHFKSNRLA